MKPVVKRTDIGHDGVTYAVHDPAGETVWQRVVWFGLDPEHRGGGSAFVSAAREQERIAMNTAAVAAGDQR